MKIVADEFVILTDELIDYKLQVAVSQVDERWRSVITMTGDVND